MKPIVAIVGRPNVGKSTLFNRITRRRDALVDDRPGVTRDRLCGDAEWNGVLFQLVDTGGFAEPDEDLFAPQIRTQVLRAVAEADAVLVLFDGRGGLTPYDRQLAEQLRRHAKPVLFAVNKIDGAEQETALADFYLLGVDPLYPVSAEHRYGLGDLLDALTAHLPSVAAAPSAEEDGVRIAVVGRPNVGKSSLINRVLGEARLVVSDRPGTTRDAVDTRCIVDGRPYLLVDTAGIRRKGRVSAKIEKFSVIKALRSLERCDVALVVLDAEEGITDQDVSIAGYAEARGCGCVFVLNKWDRVPRQDGTARRIQTELRHAAKFLHFAPAITVSALTGLRVGRIFALVDAVYAQYTSRLGTGQVNRIIERAVTRKPPSLHKGKRLKFYYATQVHTRPPRFVAFVNFPEAVHFSYRRYLVNQIREATGLDRTPLQLDLRQRTGRIDFGAKKPSSRNAKSERVRRGKGTKKK